MIVNGVITVFVVVAGISVTLFVVVVAIIIVVKSYLLSRSNVSYH